MSKKILLLTTVLAAFALAACTLTPDSDVAPRPGTPEDPAGLFYAPDLECDMLMSENAQKNCKEQVNTLIGNLIENEIVTRFDVDRCKSLQDKIGLNCQRQLEDVSVQGPISESELALFNDAVTGDVEVSEDGIPLSVDPTFDISACEGLKTPGFREYCEERVQERIDQSAFQDIISSGDATRCEELSPTLADQCLEFFNGPPEFDVPEPDFTVPDAPPARVEDPNPAS